MSLGSKYLARKTKEPGIKSEISLANMADGIVPLLKTAYGQQIEKIEFHWHDIVDDICPITIYTKKEAVRTK